MTRSEMIKMLTHAASALKPLSTGATEHAESNPQLKVDVLQMILQILQAILSQQASGEGVSTDDTVLLNDVVSILDSIRKDQANTHLTNVQIGGLQIDILQIIIQLFKAVVSHPKPPAQALFSTPASSAIAEAGGLSEAVRPLVTSDSITYTIDTLGRLTKLTYASGHTITYNYDANGNRTSVVTV